MDLNQLLSLLRFDFDLPLRVVASAYAIATAVGLFMGTSGLLALAGAAEWAQAPEAVEQSLEAAHAWLSSRAGVFGVAGLILMIGALTQTGRKNLRRSGGRAPATTLLGAGLLVEVGWATWAAVIVALVVGLWFLLAVARVIYLRTNGGFNDGAGVFSSEERMRRTWTAPVVAAVYVPVAPLTWAVR